MLFIRDWYRICVGFEFVSLLSGIYCTYDGESSSVGDSSLWIVLLSE